MQAGSYYTGLLAAANQSQEWRVVTRLGIAVVTALFKVE